RAATWFGRDASTGELLGGTVAGLDRNRLLNLTQGASRYGFHATIKAPMALADGRSQAQFCAALADFAARQQPVSLGRLRLATIEGFLALLADEAHPTLPGFAAGVVEAFEDFRAPMSPREREKRLQGGLTPRQAELLDSHGYPYVLDQFQFHMTLSDRLEPEDQAEMLAAARTWFGPALDEEVTLDRLSLFHEPDSGKLFRRLADFPLGGAL
ncbi:DUF1045 domain-containing protein, partial [Devosia sp.]|uniref:DUF1045 domain-containing protein n=1 Tax=Devosia sp. TaxID=1871048 RepID=UPI002B0004DE